MQRTPTQAKVISKTKPRDGSWLIWTLGVSLIAVFALITGMARAEDKMISAHGYSFYGDLSYPEDYTHFNYVNPDAPKGGEIALGTVGTFDSMNVYSRKGRAGTLSWMMYESLLGAAPSETNIELASAPADVRGEFYGLLAYRLEYPESKDWVIFYMRPEAKFSDGTPLTAHDVAFSHNLLLDQGLKSYADAVRKRIPKVEVLDDHTIKFYFTEGISRRTLIDQVGGVPVWSKAWYDKTDAKLNEGRMDVSPGSGPYMLDSVTINRQIIYKRNKDYWGADLPFNAGRNNFDSIRVEYFGDETAAFEAFKSGVYTFKAEGNSKRWATGYDFPNVENGTVVREEIADGAPATPTGFVFNTGSPTLADIRVREALALAFNFDWTNQSLQYGLFKQRDSFSQGSPVMATGKPEGAELDFLKSLGDVVPQEMLSQDVRVAHTSTPDRLFDRKNSRKAMRLLDDAGYKVGDNGLRMTPEGAPMKVTFLLSANSSSTGRAIIENYVSNVQKLGVDMTLEVVDGAQYTARRRDRDYDMINHLYYPIIEPDTGLEQQFGSSEAEFSVFNSAGLASPLVDAIIAKSLRSQSKEEEVASIKALDRALRRELIMVPVWYNDAYWVAYYDMFEHPETTPPYFLGYLDFWWFNQDKADALRASGVLR
jgi:microcin C transport system substrate-binding protein